MDSDVREIRKLYAQGLLSQTELAKQFNVSQSLIGEVVRKQGWKHVL